MAQNYTFNGSLTMSATSASGYTSSMSGSTTINITGVDQIASGRIDCATDADATNKVEVYEGASSGNDLIGVLKPGEFLFTIIRGTGTTTARGLGGTVTAEYFAVEIEA